MGEANIFVYQRRESRPSFLRHPVRQSHKYKINRATNAIDAYSYLITLSLEAKETLSSAALDDLP